MLYRDTESSRRLAGERHAELKQDWRPADAALAAVVESRRARRSRLAWVRSQLRSAGHAPARHAS